MKNINFYATVLVATTLLCSCSKEPAESFAGGDPTSPIVPEAEARMTVESRADLSGVVSGTAFPASTEKVFSVVGYSGTAVPTAWSSPYIPNVAVNSGAGSALSFATPQYYPANGNKVYFYAYSPVSGTYTAGSGSTAPKVKWTITGGQDIMWAKVDNGIAKAVTGSQRQPAFAFTHLLKQVKFKVVKDASFEDNIKLTSLKIVGAKTKASLALNTGTLSWETATGELTAYDNTSGQAITSTATSAGSAVMMEPGASFKVRAVAGGVTYADVTVTLDGMNAGGAGRSHEVTLTFKRSSIAPSAQIAEWTAGGTGKTGNLTYPYVADGNTIVIKDLSGEADKNRYPIHKPWSVTPSHAEANPGANASGLNTYGAKFRVAKADAVGKTGSSVTMTWYEATGTTDATYNPDGYSACARYSEETDRSDQGLWRLPTIQELMLIHDKKRDLSSACLMTQNNYWAATEVAGTSGEANTIFWEVGNVIYHGKGQGYSVRCVREPFYISADYPKVDENGYIVVRDEYATADPSIYPTHEQWEHTPPHAELEWDDNSSGLNTISEKLEVAANPARGSQSQPLVNWYEATGTQHPELNPTGYDACRAYSEPGAQEGGWRVPTIRELEYLKEEGWMNLWDYFGSGPDLWSATEYREAEHVVFRDRQKTVMWAAKVEECAVWCIRDR